jgi:hypothetical protein
LKTESNGAKEGGQIGKKKKKKKKKKKQKKKKCSRINRVPDRFGFLVFLLRQEKKKKEKSKGQRPGLKKQKKNNIK